jgi:hypothetical protein
MAGLNHNFLIIDSGSFSMNNYQEYIDSDHVELHDEILLYFRDTLSWISAFNPSLKEKCDGLCWYGVTIITVEGIDKAKSIINGWVRILSEGPDILKLKGEFYWIVGESPETGDYNKLSISKSEIVSKLEKLDLYCDNVRESNGAKCLLHLGI